MKVYSGELQMQFKLDNHLPLLELNSDTLVFKAKSGLPHYSLNTKPQSLYFDYGSVDGFVGATNYFYKKSIKGNT